MKHNFYGILDMVNWIKLCLKKLEQISSDKTNTKAGIGIKYILMIVDGLEAICLVSPIRCGLTY